MHWWSHPRSYCDGPLTWHADAVEASDLVEAGGVVVAGIGHALVDVHLAARALVTLETLALEGALGVQATAAVLAGVGAMTCLPREHSSMGGQVQMALPLTGLVSQFGSLLTVRLLMHASSRWHSMTCAV